MDRWKYFDITHRNHVVRNPTSIEKLDEMLSLLDLKPGARVVDIACGKAELLVRLAERFGIEGVGVDISPFFIPQAEKKRQERVPDADLEFILQDGAEYQPDAPESFDLAVCLGASWIFDGHRGTLQGLKKLTKPGGLVLVGEPYWITEPTEEYLAAEDITRDEFSDHYGNIVIGEEEGLTTLYSRVSDPDDWDRYEGLQWHASAEYARSNPTDPDVAELIERVAGFRESYLRWGRNTLGWAIYLFRK